jgi:hypothetical protein
MGLQSHLSNTNGGCKECINYEFQELTIKKGIEKFGNRFDYTLFKFTGASSKGIIKCIIHNSTFQVTPNNHIQGLCGGCRECFSDSIRKGKEQFITEAKQIHDNKYDYSMVIYTDTDTHVIIICDIHGEFPQTPAKHLIGQGCYKCRNIKIGLSKQLSIEDYIKKCIQQWGDRNDYSESIYNGCYEPITIRCKRHGYFTLSSASWHYSESLGCRICSRAGYSRVQICWLDYEASKHKIYIQHSLNSNEYRIPNSHYLADGYCEQTNTIYEFQGDYFHGNPKIYRSDVINDLCKKTMGELYKTTQVKKEFIISLGYNYVEMWENDWLKMIRVIKKIQKKWKKIYKNRRFKITKV